MRCKQGYLKESEIDRAVTRLFTARMKLGMFDPPEMVPYSKIDEKELNSAEHRALARKLANESMVLLKNDGVLPLKTTGTKIAVVGPLADQTQRAAGQLQRHSDAYGLDPGGNQEGVPEGDDHLCGGNAVPGNRCGAGAGERADGGRQAGHQSELFEARHEQSERPDRSEAGGRARGRDD